MFRLSVMEYLQVCFYLLEIWRKTSIPNGAQKWTERRERERDRDRRREHKEQNNIIYIYLLCLCLFNLCDGIIIDIFDVNTKWITSRKSLFDPLIYLSSYKIQCCIAQQNKKRELKKNGRCKNSKLYPVSGYLFNLMCLPSKILLSLVHTNCVSLVIFFFFFASRKQLQSFKFSTLQNANECFLNKTDSSMVLFRFSLLTAEKSGSGWHWSKNSMKMLSL